ncbi:MAG: class I SAM-dependent methyltransferase [Bacteroidota bacterium]
MPLLQILRCPVTRSTLKLKTFSSSSAGNEILEGILFAENDWFYPVIKGIPRLTVEAFIDYEDFFETHFSAYQEHRDILEKKYHRLIKYVTEKNKRTKESFSREWKLFNYKKDKTWDQDSNGMMNRFLDETGETLQSLKGKIIFDAGCGNGLLNQYIAAAGAVVLGMDFSLSIEKAYQQNTNPDALFIQGDVQFPPLAFEYFDIVHCSGVLIHTNNTELSFSCIEPCTKKGGKLSVWLYHPRRNFSHNLFNFIRKGTSRLPAKVQYYLYAITLFPLSFIIKRIKGNKQNTREMMIDILDWFSPEFRWEHEPSEAAAWFYKRNYSSVKITTLGIFGFNITGIKDQIEGK